MCELIIDCPHSTPKWTDEGYIVTRNQNIKNGTLSLSTPSFTNKEGYLSRIKRAKPQAGDIIFTREAPMGEVCLIPEGIQCCLGQRQVLLRPKSEICGEYLFWALQSPFVQHQISWNEGTGSTVSNVRIPVLKALNIPRLPYHEERIAKVLSNLANKTQLNTQTNQTLEAIAQAIFKSWFVDFDPVKAKIAVLESGGSAEEAELAAMSVISSLSLEALAELKQSNLDRDAHDCMDAGGRAAQGAAAEGDANVAGGRMPGATYQQLAQTAALFPSRMQESELGEIPEGWEKGTLQDVLQFTSERIQVSSLDLDHYISTENMLENRKGITSASNLPTVNTVPAFHKCDILISNIRPYFKKIWLATFNGGRSADVLGFSSLEKKETEFVYNLVYQDRFFEYMMTTSKGAKMPRGDKDAIMKFPFSLPPKDLREKFSKKTKSFYPFIMNLNSEKTYLQELRNTLLPKLLSGEIDLSTLNEETSEANA
ncbi:restriction endonuclease subunit S [Teredinibacter purpureus]|uniref:restriction endonuclease subunit S n=1 Tax=Teredinibacter purpureus TaxID=2731756 RepID=UPI0005F7D589|nr:restriction endonuclease subunit S [Teredinibacter purpureus]